MYLSKIEIFGFKSFAHKTVFKFTDGLTAIVGPNGCGKTNVVDAIRWVLGEQKTSVLRSDVMENVIFNGSAGRKPVALAEVTLTIENNKHILPSEYNEISVTRRLFRDGESVYILNGVPCRLRDILDLFMDTGMGPDSYSVIELKMVEAILSGRAEERRHLIEEAAGVNKFKLRKKEADRKLVSVRSDLDRVEDIVQEIEKNVSSLARQATKTRKYNEYFQALKTLELLILSHEYEKYSKDYTKLEEEIATIKVEQVDIEKQLEENEENDKKLKLAITELEKLHSGELEKESQAQSLVAEFERKFAVSKEKYSNNQSAQERLSKEIENSEMERKLIASQREIISNQADDLQKKSVEMQQQLDILRQDRNQFSSRTQKLRQISNSANETVLDVQNSIRSLNELLRRNETRNASIKNRIAQGEEEHFAINEQIVGLDSDIKAVLEKKDELTEHYAAAEKNLYDSQEKKNNLSTEIENLNRKINETSGEISHLNASLQFLSNLVDTAESSKFLLGNNDWKPTAEKILLAEAIGVDDEHRIALESALQEAGRYFVVDSEEDAIAAIRLLEQSEKGKASFICRNLIPKTEGLPGIESVDGIIGWASEIVRSDDELRSALRLILRKTLIVENLEIARKIIQSGIAEKAVTLKGEIFGAAGLLRGGAASQEEGKLVGKQERIKKLNSSIARLRKTLETIETELNTKKAEHESIDIRSLNEQLKIAGDERNKNERTIIELDGKRKALENKIILLEENLLNFEHETEDINNEQEDARSQIESLNSNLTEAREEYENTLEKLSEAETEVEETEKNVRTAELEFVRLTEDIKTHNKEITRLEQDFSSCSNSIISRKEEFERTKEGSIQLEKLIDELTANLNGEEINYKTKKTKREYLSHQVASVQEQHEASSTMLNNLMKKHEKVLESVYERGIHHSQLRIEINNAVNKAIEQYSTDIRTDKIQMPEGFSHDTSTANAANLRQKLAGLGSVNFMALEEYETQSERLSFYKKQIKDLVDSEKTLRETIVEINKNAEEKFVDTFTKIQENFKQLFLTLFGEGAEGELRLMGDNPLESDIEIIAKPPGKRPHSIDMLSGGEKTLSAISLLFSIYLVKPSPFCILDEVDAPLDDANIGRYLMLLREFSNNTQFLIVTHNKKTMEAADNLYGITMEEIGISSVASVRLAKVLAQ
ncbi:MAG: Smc family protein [Ignavibacteria bacterium]|nr:Smc family protein [Ignavibacteria bacterium]